MSWKFPRHPIQSGRVPNVDDTNANFREFTEEIGGKLNEQNWHKDAVDSHSQIARKAAFVWHYARSSHINFLGGDTSGRFELKQTPEWQAISRCSLSIATAECLLYINAAWQVASIAVANLVDQNEMMAMFGIRVDGLVIPESIIGTGEERNDFAGGVAYGGIPLASSIVLPVSSGVHTIDLVGRGMLEKYDAAAATEGTHAERSESVYIWNRDLIVLEMRR